MTFSQIPFKAHFAQKNCTSECASERDRTTIYFLLFKTKLIASHGSPANCFSIFPHTVNFPSLHIEFIFLHIYGPGSGWKRFIAWAGITDWDNLWYASWIWGLRRKSAVDSAASWSLFSSSIAYGHPHALDHFLCSTSDRQTVTSNSPEPVSRWEGRGKHANADEIRRSTWSQEELHDKLRKLHNLSEKNKKEKREREGRKKRVGIWTFAALAFSVFAFGIGYEQKC